MPVGDASVFTALDCAFLEQFAGGTQTSDLTEDQPSRIADLRTRLLEAATTVADQLSADWRPFSRMRFYLASAATWPNCSGLAHTRLLRPTSRSGCRSRSSCNPAASSCASASALVSASLSPATLATSSVESSRAYTSGCRPRPAA